MLLILARVSPKDHPARRGQPAFAVVWSVVLYRLEIDLTVPGTGVFTGWFERTHPSTLRPKLLVCPKPGYGASGRIGVYSRETPVHLPCLSQNLCRNHWHYALRSQTSGLACAARSGQADPGLSPAAARASDVWKDAIIVAFQRRAKHLAERAK